MRLIHRDLSYIFAGMLLIYAISGIALNHKDSFNSQYSIERSEHHVTPVAKDEINRLEEELENRIASYDKMLALWGEFDTSLLTVENVEMDIKKIAGVRIPILKEVIYQTKPFSVFSAPKWYADGLSELKNLAQVGIEREFCAQKLQLLEYARKKTTQKVNLFEKVQIPGYEDAIRKIKRFMEDEENLSKSSQKIVKAKRV